MKIIEVRFENFMCYYGPKLFRLSNGLNIILGKNGDGKTKFFEGLEWVFNGPEKPKLNLVSAKALNELEEESSFEVKVSIEVEQYGQEKTLSRSFLVSKDSEGDIILGEGVFTGVERNQLGEREDVDAKNLSHQIFDPSFRRYCMFKGEEELRVLEKPELLTPLVKLFSDAKEYKKYIEKGDYCLQKADQALTKDAKKNKKNEKELNSLEYEISILKRKRQDAQERKNIRESSIEKIDSQIKKIERLVDNGEKVKTLNNRIRRLDNEIIRRESLVNERGNFTVSLFDKGWITMYFEEVHEEYMAKVNAFSKERRQAQQQFDRELGKQEGEKELKEKLLGFIPLPVGTPSRAHMQEMLDDQLCKVCNREAKSGTPAFEFMQKRLLEFIESQEKRPREIRKLFEKNFTRKLVSLGEEHDQELTYIKNMGLEIKENFESIKEFKDKIVESSEKKEAEERDLNALIGSSNASNQELLDAFRNYTGFRDEKAKEGENLAQIDRQLLQIDAELAIKEGQKSDIQKEQAIPFLVNTKDILSKIITIFRDTQKRKFDNFVKELESRSDEIFKKANYGSFSGKIKFFSRLVRNEESIRIELQDSEGKIFNANKGQETMMNVAILLAISSMVREKEEESYPLIMDAPTSTFDNEKMRNFFKSIKESVEQSIILTKDFVMKDSEGRPFIHENFKELNYDKAIWLQLDKNVVSEDLHTVNTLISEI